MLKCIEYDMWRPAPDSAHYSFGRDTWFSLVVVMVTTCGWAWGHSFGIAAPEHVKHSGISVVAVSTIHFKADSES